MSCGDAKTMSSSKSGTSIGTSSSTADAAALGAGVSLGAAIEQLLYFNGRFLKAEDLKLEQTGYLTRIALSERAQGAGVSYGFHVTTATAATPSNFVKSVADAVFAKMKANRTEWVDFLDDAVEGSPPLGDAALVERLAGALDALCGAPPSGSGVVLTIGPGHAADGYGHDLLLDSPHQVKLGQLIDAFTAAPTSTDAPGPAVTPKPMTGAPTLTGAFLLTIRLENRDHGNVPVYGAQCTDAKTAACSLGYRSSGIAAELVFFDALDGSVAATDWWAWRGMGARAYFEKETQARPSLLSNMVATLPFSAAAQAPETGTHVPIGVVYLSNGNFVTFDPWTSKRLRSPGELTYWLRTLLYPPQVSQLARVLQFQSQLTDALSGGVAAGTRNLWKLGFAAGAELVLPGVGFLPIPISANANGSFAVNAAMLKQTLDAYFDGVPYKLIAATEGEMNAVFVGALESGELRLTRAVISTIPGTGKNVLIGDDRQEALHPAQAYEKAYEVARDLMSPGEREWLSTWSDAAHTRELQAFKESGHKPIHLDVYESSPPEPGLDPAQVFVWVTPNPFPGYVMFTWPAPLPRSRTTSVEPTERPRICTQVRLRPRGEDGPQFEVLGHDGEWATYFTSGMGRFFFLAGIRLELERAFTGLALNYAFVTDTGLEIPPQPDGWLMVPEGGGSTNGGPNIVGLRVWLTGTEALNYSVLYRIRMRLSDFFYIDSPTFQNGEVLGGHELWTKISPAVYQAALDAALQRFNPEFPPEGGSDAEAFWASIVPRCPSEGRTNHPTVPDGFAKKYREALEKSLKVKGRTHWRLRWGR